MSVKEEECRLSGLRNEKENLVKGGVPQVEHIHLHSQHDALAAQESELQTRHARSICFLQFLATGCWRACFGYGKTLEVQEGMNSRVGRRLQELGLCEAAEVAEIAALKAANAAKVHELLIDAAFSSISENKSDVWCSQTVLRCIK